MGSKKQHDNLADASWLEEYRENRWLNLGDTSKISTVNPFAVRTQYEIDNPHIHLLDMMRKPENFAFTCKILFGKTLAPFQVAILQELWKRPFPMLIASRGAGKSFLLGVYCMLRLLFDQGSKIVVCGGGFRQAKVVFDYCADLWDKGPVYQDVVGYHKTYGPKRDIDRCTLRVGESILIALPLGDGCLSSSVQTTYNDRFGHISDNTREESVTPTRDVGVWGNGKFRITDESYRNGVRDTKIIRTSSNYTFEGTHNHKMKVVRAGSVDWVRADEMVIGDKLMIDRSLRWHSGSFSCSDDEAYSIGAVMGKDKVIPPRMLKCDRKSMRACLSALFDTDGAVRTTTAKGGIDICVSFCNTSKALVSQIQYILLHFGIVTTIGSRKREECYELLITGYNCALFSERIGFRRPHKAKILTEGLSGKKRFHSTADCVPDIRDLMISTAAERKVRRGTATKDYDRVSPSRLRKLKSVTQAKAQLFLKVYGHLDDPRIHKIKELANPDIYYDEVVSIEEGNCETFDIHVPEGHEYCANGFFSHNSKIRGQRANIVISDEFASTNKDIFETVVRGFAAVSSSPIEKYRQEMKTVAMQELGLWTDAMAALHEESLTSNQTIISGTAYYSFNHFFDYWKRYKAIVESKGDKKLLQEIFAGRVPENFNWTDYSVIRLPYTMLPPGFMDEKQISQAKATIHLGIFSMEYGCQFQTDSNGFFKRSLVESCVVGKPTGDPIEHLSCGTALFTAVLRGSPLRKYVIAVDPASESDNFSIVVLELWPEHRRIVHCWTTTRQRYKAKVRSGLVEETEFYHYASQKIRQLMRDFPCTSLAIDAQGGGIAIIESLQDKTRLQPGERPLLPTIDPDDKKPSDYLAGDHCITVIQFADAKWVASANHGMRKDFEDKSLLFPDFDTAQLALALEEDKHAGRIKVDTEGELDRLYDTLEDCITEIEQLKDELATITHSQTGVSMRDRWDTPETKGEFGRKGRLRKDRYSSLLMANAVARELDNIKVIEQEDVHGGFAHELGQPSVFGDRKDGPLWIGPAWLTEGSGGSMAGGAVVFRGNQD